MKKFALLFRMDLTNQEAQPSKEQMEIYMQQWMAWINEIVATGQLADGGDHFSKKGRVLQSDNSVTEGPLVTDHKAVAGFIIISAADLNGATKIAEKCPILKGENTSVEIRELAVPGE